MTDFKVGDRVRTFYFGVPHMAEIVEIRVNRIRLRFTVAPDNFRQPDGLVREHWRSKKVVEQDNGFFPIALIHFAMCNPKTTSIIVSSSLRQSMETFDKVVMFLYGSVLESSVASHTRTRIMFKNGARIICLPCGRYGFSLRGLTVHFAVLDEAAFMPEEVISNVVFPMLATTNGILWMLTTPWSYVGSPPKVDAEWKEGGK